jgi:hypothetical protein
MLRGGGKQKAQAERDRHYLEYPLCCYKYEER